MNIRAKAIMFAAAAVAVAGAYAAYPNAKMYDGAVTNTWESANSGDSGLWNTPENWSCNAVPVGGGQNYEHVEGYEDIAGKGGIRGVYAKFAGDSAITVTATNNAPASEAFNTRGVIIASGCGAVTIRRAPHWESSGITLGMNNNRPSFFNYSSNRAVFDIITRFGGLSYGETGILPGAEFQREFNYTNKSGGDFYFYAGDPERSDYENTTILKADAKFGAHNVFVQANHIVEVQGSISSSNAVSVTGSLILNGATVSVASLATEDDGEIHLSGTNTFTTASSMSVGSLTLDDGAAILLAGGEISFNQTFAAEEIIVSGGVTLGSWPLAEGEKLLIQPPDSFAPGSIYAVFSIPTSVKTVTADDFEVVLQGAFAQSCQVFIETDEDGLQTVSLSMPDEYAYLKTNQRYSGTWSDEGIWTNSTGKVVALDVHCKYVVDGYGSQLWLRTPGDRDLSFPGDALIVQGGKADSADPFQKAALGLKGQMIEVGDLRLGESGGIGFLSYNVNPSAGQTLSGSISVAEETASNPAYIFGSGNYINRINSAISGSGQLRITPYDYDKKCTTFYLNGDNSAYTGEMRLDYYSTTDNYPTICVTNANALGGNPSSQNLNALRLNASRLEILDDVSMTAENRVLNVMRSSQLYVADGKTFSIASPLYFDSSTADSNLLRKLGGGDFVLKGRTLSAGTIQVEDGRVIADNPYAAAGVTAECADGACALLPTLADAITEEDEAALSFEKDWVFIPGGSINVTPEVNLQELEGMGWQTLNNWGLDSRWIVSLGQYEVDGGVMLTVSGKGGGFMLIIL